MWVHIWSSYMKHMTTVIVYEPHDHTRGPYTRGCGAGEGSYLDRNVQRFRGGLVFKAHRLCASLNSRLESDQEEDKKGAGHAPPLHVACSGRVCQLTVVPVNLRSCLSTYGRACQRNKHRLSSGAHPRMLEHPIYNPNLHMWGYKTL